MWRQFKRAKRSPSTTRLSKSAPEARSMRRVASVASFAVIVLFPAALFAADSGHGVSVIANEAQRRVDITIDGKPFTSFIWPTTLKKPTLFPLVTDEGITVTRGYPLEPRAAERVDHPHHAGLWFNYGN